MRRDWVKEEESKGKWEGENEDRSEAGRVGERKGGKSEVKRERLKWKKIKTSTNDRDPQPKHAEALTAKGRGWQGSAL